MPKIGPFFYIRGKLIADAVPLSEGRRQADKLDNSFGHDALYDRHFRTGDYIDFPRGRVVWDLTADRAIVYLDACLDREEIKKQIALAFSLEEYTVAFDDHYRCPACMGELWD